MAAETPTPQAAHLGAPALSVVLLTPDGFSSIRKTVRHIQAQTIRERIEVVIGVPVAAAIQAQQEELEGLWGYQVVEVGPIHSTGVTRAALVRHAKAPVVALGEDHCFPEPDWAERLLDAHREDWAAVGPLLENANPDTLLSWAHLLIEYGPWMRGDSPAEAEHLPGHNSSYKRDVLLAYGDRLETMLEAESVMHWDLRAQGHRLLHDPAMRTRHLNFSRLGTSLQLRFHGGRLFGAARARGWKWPRRMAYAAAGPLIPLVRFQRIARQLWGLPPHGRRWVALLPILVLLAADGAGEVVGYLAGMGRSLPKLTALEFHRQNNLIARERHLALD